MARLPRFDFPGSYHHIMLRGNQGNFIFNDNSDFKIYLDLLNRAKKEKEFKLLAYCLMSNHIHLLLKTGPVHLSKIMQWLGVNYTKYFNKKYEVSGHVFQGRYKNILVEKDSYLLEVSRYIHLNPVMAGIIERPEDYGWSSYSVYIGLLGKDHVDKQEILDEFSVDYELALKKYRRFVEDRLTEKTGGYPDKLIKQVILGSKGFAELMLRKFREEKGISNIESGNHISREEIIEYIKDKFGVTVEELKNGGKNRRISEIRKIIIYLLKERVHVESTEISELLNLDISTISRSCQEINKKINNKNSLIIEVTKPFC